MDGQQLRAAMRTVPSAVTVVTAANGHERRGITIGSFTSVSLDPPLISFNIALDAQMHDLLVGAEHFYVHILSDEQAHLSNHFAEKTSPDVDQFAPVRHRLDDNDTPILEDVLAVFNCAHYAVYPAGDHSLVVGQVRGLKTRDEGTPLLYYDRTYCSVGEEVSIRSVVPVKRASNEIP